MPMPQPGVDFDEAEHPPASEAHPLIARAAKAGAVQTLWGFDYAWENLSLARLIQVLTQNGTDIALRYLNDPGGKGISAAEARALDAANIMIGAIWEVGGTSFRGGYSAGLSDGQAAQSIMRNLGVSSGALCWFTVDTDTADYGSTNAYLKGCKAGTGPYIAQLYGKYGVVEAAAAAGLGTNHYQTYAWSAGKLSSNAAVYQYQNGVMVGGVSMDRDRTLKPLNGTWAHAGNSPVQPPPDWTEQMIMTLPTLGPSDTDTPGEIQYVHRIQALVRVIGQINSRSAAAAVTTDGVYGPQTVAGVKDMQDFFGLSVDGITGQATWHHLVTGG